MSITIVPLWSICVSNQQSDTSIFGWSVDHRTNLTTAISRMEVDRSVAHHAYPSEWTLPSRGSSVKIADTTDTASKDHTTRYDGVLSMSHINWVVVELSASWYLSRIPWQSILLQEHARFPRSREWHPSNSLDAALICHLRFSPQRIRKPWETGMMWSIIELSVFACQNWWHMGTFFKRANILKTRW